jgi:glycosyltransferase involved in cell wall biosynthesis
MEFPDATLDIYCDLQQEWVNTLYPDMMNSIKKLLRINRTGVQVHGWVDKQQLAQAWSRSEYFLYPCIFEETFCLTALEAAISGTCIISNGLAALGETARHGILVEGNPLTYDWENRCFEKLKYIVKSHNYRNHVIEKNYEWAKTLTWKDQTRKLLEFIK